MATPDDLNKSAEDLIEMLDLWELRNKDAIRYSREHQRQPFRQICKIAPIDNDYNSLGLSEGQTLKVWARDLTPGGMGFITTQNINPTDIVICISGEDGGAICVRAKVKRKRKVHQDFWEFGVQFLEKVSEEETPAAVKKTVLV